jgi:hypothetical protein
MFTRRGLNGILSIDGARLAFNTDIPTGKDKNAKRTLLSVLSHNRRAEATYPRDKCLALAGLTYHGVFSLTAKRYLQPVDDVYTFTAQLIAMELVQGGSGPLNFLEHAGNHRKVLNLRSWVPDWSYTGNRPLLLLYPQHVNGNDPEYCPYNSTAGSSMLIKPNCSFSKNGLSAGGFIYDSVDGIIICDCEHQLHSSGIHTRRRIINSMAEIRERIINVTVLKRLSNTRRAHLSLVPADSHAEMS